MNVRKTYTEEQVGRVCADIRRRTRLEQARRRLKWGYAWLCLMLVTLAVLFWRGAEWHWGWLVYFLVPLSMIVDGHRVLRGRKP